MADWIVDRPPTRKDADPLGNVAIADTCAPGFWISNWASVKRGQPWILWTVPPAPPAGEEVAA